MTSIPAKALVFALLLQAKAPADWESHLAWFEQQPWSTDDLKVAARAVREQVDGLAPDVPRYAREANAAYLAHQLEVYRIVAGKRHSDEYRAASAADSLMNLALQLMVLKARKHWPTEAEREEIVRRYRGLREGFQASVEEFRREVHPDALSGLLKGVEALLESLVADMSGETFRYRPSDEDLAELRRLFEEACRGLAKHYQEIDLKRYQDLDRNFVTRSGIDVSLAMASHMRRAAASAVAGDTKDAPPVPPELLALHAKVREELPRLGDAEEAAIQAAWEETDRKNREEASPQALARRREEIAAEFLRGRGPMPQPIRDRRRPNWRAKPPSGTTSRNPAIYANLVILGLLAGLYGIDRLRGAMRRDREDGPSLGGSPGPSEAK